MTITLNPNEVSLNGVRFPLIGKIRPSLVSKQPEKQVLGDYSLETNPVVSTWGQKTGKNGILLEEMDETKEAHQNRSYWATSDDRYTTVLPPLPTAITAPADVAPTITDAGMEASSAAWVDETSFSGTHVHGGSLALYEEVTFNQTQIAYQLLTGYLRGATYVVSAWIYGGSTGDTNPYFSIGIDDGISVQYGSETSAVGSFVQVTATITISPGATKCQLNLRSRTQFGNSGTVTSWWDDATITLSAITYGTSTCHANFDSDYYMSYGTVLAKLNGAGTAFTSVSKFAANITALVGPINGTLLIFLGDSNNYWYMSAAEVLTQTDVSAANLGEIWDGKAFKIDTSGNMKHSATPNAASPTWTTSDSGYSLSNFPANSVNCISLYRDADQAYILYAGTKFGLWAYDFANSKWEKTELTMPNHDTAGKGLIHWRTGLYVSSGLQVDRYIAADTAQIESVGLTKDDGLIATRGGEIVKFIQGYDEFYALVDSTYEGTGSRSTVMAFNENGWRCVYEESADNKAMYSGLVTSVVRHQLIFASASGVYWIPLTKNIIAPKKVTGYTYAASAIRILPWFDGNSPGVAKLALRLKVKSRGCSANETITPKYRIDHANIDLSTGWTSLAAITTDVITTYTFASDVGLSFKAFQLRFDLARGGTTTNSPEIEWFSLEYLRSNPIVWGYEFTVNCETKREGYLAPGQLIDALKTVTELTTLATIGWRNDAGGTETYKCRVWDISGQVQTGVLKEGQFRLMVIVP